MKAIRRMIGCVSLAIAMAGAASADIVFVADLTTSQEPSLNGPTTSTGDPRPVPFGNAVFVLNDAMTQLTMTATIYNIDVTGSQTADTNDNLINAHIHAGPNLPPQTNGVVWGFFGSPFNNTSPNDGTLTPFATGAGGTFTGVWNAPEGNNTTLADQIPNLFSGRAYINFHTVQNRPGEIRGAINPVPEPSTVALAAAGTLALLLRRRRLASRKS